MLAAAPVAACYATSPGADSDKCTVLQWHSSSVTIDNRSRQNVVFLTFEWHLFRNCLITKNVPIETADQRRVIEILYTFNSQEIAEQLI